MNPEMFQNPEKFLLPFIQAREAQGQLQDKLIEVEDNFASMQAVLGMLMDNPWLFFLFLQREVRRLDVPINGVAKAEIDKLKAEIEDLKKLPVKIWENLRAVFCKEDVVVFLSEGNLIITGLNLTTQGDTRKSFMNLLKTAFDDAGKPSGVQFLLELCPDQPDQNVVD